MKERSNGLEIKTDVFYVKQSQRNEPLKYAYLHLAEKGGETFLAVFENADVQIPSVYWWNEDNVDAKEISRHLIMEVVGEAYISLYIKYGLIKPTDMPLWEEVRLENSGATSEWRDIVENINRENYGSRKK